MKYKYTLHEWTNGAKGTDWTQYLTFPIFIEDKLDETLDTGQVVLECVPIAHKTPFAPKTKFKLERYLLDEHGENFQDYWDMIVEKDEVEEHVGAPSICTHRIHLIEASAVAQGMHCDNIALTYELQDVSLNYRTTVPAGDTLDVIPGGVVANENGHNAPIHESPQIITLGRYYFRNSYRYVWSDRGNIGSLYYSHDASSQETLTFTFPTLTAQGAVGQGRQWGDICECETIGTVVRRHFRGSTLLETSTILTAIMGPTELPANLDVRTTGQQVWGTSHLGTVGAAPNPMSARAAVILTSFDFYRPIGLVSQGPSGIPQFNQRTGVGAVSADSPEPARISHQNPNAVGKTHSFTTAVLSESQLRAGEFYTYEIRCQALLAQLPIFYQYGVDVTRRTNPIEYRATSITNNLGTYTNVAGSSISFSGTIIGRDLFTDAVGTNFLVRPRRYNCYDMVRKTLLTSDMQLVDNRSVGLEEIQYPIIIDDTWEARLKGTQMFETIFEQKNLWEVLLQVGQYLHAIPYLEFAQDGTDRFVLRFRQLGGTIVDEDISTKISIFNSKTLAEFFTQYDSYVTNLFSPQNIVDEFVVAKTSDSTFLVSNNTAEIHTKFPIFEIVSFEITHGLQTIDATQHIFENSIYQILTPNQSVRPSKAFALYYSLGDNKIQGLNYTPPTVNNDGLFALKNIVSLLFGENQASLKFNSLRFRIRYRTKASNRISMVRPDLQGFAKNSNLENYPRHNQFFGQQEKIVDSERFSANLWGRLIRVANNVCQAQEYADYYSEKQSGDLIQIDNEPYYVMSTENELYLDGIFQKVTYSKNFNQIANIVTIPSEPRFYEVSERSQVRREVLMMEFLMLSGAEPATTINAKLLSASTWRNLIRHLIFSDGTAAIPNFAYTLFRADLRREHTGSFGQTLPPQELFPSSEITIGSGNSIVPRPSSDRRGVITPLMRHPLKNAISFTWGMEDNFKAGDAVDPTTFGTNGNDSVNDAYVSQQPVRYCDIMGRADLVEFRLFNRTTAWTNTQIERLPFAEENRDFVPSAAASQILTPANMSLGLDKDNREAIGFNYQINLLTENNNFITFPNLFGEKSNRLRLCLLNAEVSQFDENVEMSRASIIADNAEWQAIPTTMNRLEIRIETPNGVDLTSVKSICFYEPILDDSGNVRLRFATIARNVGNLPNNQKLQSWWLQPTFN